MVRKITHTFLFIILFSSTFFPQDWFWQNPLPQGDEKTTIVNEEKPVEEYEVKFIGMGLPSGIYFYQLKAGDYIATKKMVLLK